MIILLVGSQINKIQENKIIQDQEDQSIIDPILNASSVSFQNINGEFEKNSISECQNFNSSNEKTDELIQKDNSKNNENANEMDNISNYTSVENQEMMKQKNSSQSLSDLINLQNKFEMEISESRAIQNDEKFNIIIPTRLIEPINKKNIICDISVEIFKDFFKILNESQYLLDQNFFTGSKQTPVCQIYNNYLKSINLQDKSIDMKYDPMTLNTYNEKTKESVFSINMSELSEFNQYFIEENNSYCKMKIQLLQMLGVYHFNNYMIQSANQVKNDNEQLINQNLSILKQKNKIKLEIDSIDNKYGKVQSYLSCLENKKKVILMLPEKKNIYYQDIDVVNLNTLQISNLQEILLTIYKQCKKNHILVKLIEQSIQKESTEETIINGFKFVVILSHILNRMKQCLLYNQSHIKYLFGLNKQVLQIDKNKSPDSKKLYEVINYNESSLKVLEKQLLDEKNNYDLIQSKLGDQLQKHQIQNSSDFFISFKINLEYLPSFQDTLAKFGMNIPKLFYQKIVQQFSIDNLSENNHIMILNSADIKFENLYQFNLSLMNSFLKAQYETEKFKNLRCSTMSEDLWNDMKNFKKSIEELERNVVNINNQEIQLETIKDHLLGIKNEIPTFKKINDDLIKSNELLDNLNIIREKLFSADINNENNIQNNNENAIKNIDLIDSFIRNTANNMNMINLIKELCSDKKSLVLTKKSYEEIKVTLDSHTQLNNQIKSLINNLSEAPSNSIIHQIFISAKEINNQNMELYLNYAYFIKNLLDQIINEINYFTLAQKNWPLIINDVEKIYEKYQEDIEGQIKETSQYLKETINQYQNNLQVKTEKKNNFRQEVVQEIMQFNITEANFLNN